MVAVLDLLQDWVKEREAAPRMILLLKMRK